MWFRTAQNRDDVIKWKHFPRYWPFLRGNHRPPVDSPQTDQWGGALMSSLICAWTHCWANIGDAGNIRRHRAYHDVAVKHHRQITTLPMLLKLILTPDLFWYKAGHPQNYWPVTVHSASSSTTFITVKINGSMGFPSISLLSGVTWPLHGPHKANKITYQKLSV